MNVYIEKINALYNYLVFSAAAVHARFWKMFAKSMGKEVYFLSGVKLNSPSNVEIGNYVSINCGTSLGGKARLKVGDYVNIGPNCMITTSAHRFDAYDVPMAMQGVTSSPITIEDDVWIGMGVIILPGVTIGRGAIVGANAVVTKNVPAYSIVGGVPARLIRYRFDENTIKKAMNIDLTRRRAK